MPAPTGKGQDPGGLVSLERGADLNREPRPGQVDRPPTLGLRPGTVGTTSRFGPAVRGNPLADPPAPSIFVRPRRSGIPRDPNLDRKESVVRLGLTPQRLRWLPVLALFVAVSAACADPVAFVVA